MQRDVQVHLTLHMKETSSLTNQQPVSKQHVLLFPKALVHTNENCLHPLAVMSFQPCMTIFLLLNTKNILKNVFCCCCFCISLHTMKVNDVQNNNGFVWTKIFEKRFLSDVRGSK